MGTTSKDLNVADVAENDAEVDESVKEALLDAYFERCYFEEGE